MSDIREWTDDALEHAGHADLVAESLRLRRYLRTIAALHADEYCDMGPRLECLARSAFGLPIPTGYECFLDAELVARIESQS